MPEFEPPAWAPTPDARVSVVEGAGRCNWAQILEGADRLGAQSRACIRPTWRRRRSTAPRRPNANWLRPSTDKAPRLQIERTTYGFRYAAIRRPIKNAATHDYVRITVVRRAVHRADPAEQSYNVATLLIPETTTHTMFYFIAWNDADKPGIDAGGWRKFCVAQIGRRRRRATSHSVAQRATTVPAGPRRR